MERPSDLDVIAFNFLMGDPLLTGIPEAAVDGPVVADCDCRSCRSEVKW